MFELTYEKIKCLVRKLHPARKATTSRKWILGSFCFPFSFLVDETGALTHLLESCLNKQ